MTKTCREPDHRRRQLLLAGTALAVAGAARATPAEMAAAIGAFTGGVAPKVGKVVLEVM